MDRIQEEKKRRNILRIGKMVIILKSIVNIDMISLNVVVAGTVVKKNRYFDHNLSCRKE